MQRPLPAALGTVCVHGILFFSIIKNTVTIPHLHLHLATVHAPEAVQYLFPGQSHSLDRKSVV